MTRLRSRPAVEPISGRDAAWYEELSDAVERARAGTIARPTSGTEGFWIRLLVAPVADIAFSLVSLVDAGQPWDSLECEAAVRRLLKPSQTLDSGETAVVLSALRRTGHATRAICGETIHDGINRLVGLQKPDGGWAASAGDAPDAPSCPALTARVMEALGAFGFRIGQPPIASAVEFLQGQQEEPGSWSAYGGGSRLRTTWQVLAGLHAIESDMNAILVRRAVRWLMEAQNADGGWGETATSAASPTAWAVLALLTAGEAESAEVRAGVEFLVGTQRANGGWTGATHFPLMAIARYARAVCPIQTGVAGTGYRLDPGHAQPGASAESLHAPTER
jgi:squalene-hopene/tetraprenyl-beta-curcumene cyclase